MSVIRIKQLTKAFAPNKGIFDVSFTINRGEVFGFLGPNGAGKTTTIRHLMGFIKPQYGQASIMELDCWSQQRQIQRYLGYLPAEIAFPENMTGIQLISYVAKMRKQGSLAKAEALIHRFQLDPSGKIDRMSKGMKQKIGIVCAFMHDPEVLILDEPTSGLDPLMQSAFVSLLQEEKRKGASILLSSHVFEEIEVTCDRLGIIKQGRIVSMLGANELRQTAERSYTIELVDAAGLTDLEEAGFKCEDRDDATRSIVVHIDDGQINELLRVLSRHTVQSFREHQAFVGQHFIGLYKGENTDV